MNQQPRKLPIRVTVGVSPKSPIGVAIAEYSGRRSRMVAWDAKTLKLIGFQDLKARASLIDVSDCGNYCCYDVERFTKGQSYIAISRPPYFQALWLRNCFHLGQRFAVFMDQRSIHYRLFEPHPGMSHKAVSEQLVQPCPFQFMRIDKIDSWDEYTHVIARSSGFAEYARWLTTPPRLPKAWVPKLKIPSPWTGTDCQGRVIREEQGVLYANESAFLNLERQEFEHIPPPHRVKHW